jgi:uncharacterized protein YciI
MELFATTYVYDDRADERDAIRQSHLDYLDALVEAGSLFAYGKYADAQAPGALFIYYANSSEVVEAWVAGDPYVAAGLVPEQIVRVWPALGTWPQSLESRA